GNSLGAPYAGSPFPRPRRQGRLSGRRDPPRRRRRLLLGAGQEGRTCRPCRQIGDDARDARLKGELAAAGVDLSRLVQKTGHVSSDRWIFEEDDASEKTTLIMPGGSYPEDAIKPE